MGNEPVGEIDKLLLLIQRAEFELGECGGSELLRMELGKKLAEFGWLTRLEEDGDGQ